MKTNKSDRPHNKFAIGNLVNVPGRPVSKVVDFRYDEGSGGYLYDLASVECDEETNDVPEDKITEANAMERIILENEAGSGRTGSTYHFEIPHAVSVRSVEYDTIEECVAACKKACREFGVDYDRRDVKLFLTNRDGTEECTEEGEFAG